MSGEMIRVIFTGICTFVGADVGHNNRPVTAVFANASHHQPAHYVNMIVANDDYVIDTDAPSEELVSPLGRPFRVIRIDGKSIALAGVTETGLKYSQVVLSKEAEEQHRPTNILEVESVKWIPSLGRSWPRMWPLRAARRMRRGFFSVDSDPHLVSASFELPGGMLASNWVSSDIWRFTPRSHTRFRYVTATAQEVRFDTKIGTDVVHFDLCDLQTRRPCAYVHIKRRKPAGRNDPPIQVVIANVPDEDRLPDSIVFCGACASSEGALKAEDPAPCTCVDHHFSNYYDALTDQLPERPSLPRRIATGPPLVPTALRVGGGNCPPSDYPGGTP